MTKPLSQLLAEVEPKYDFGSDAKGIVVEIEDIQNYCDDGWDTFRAVDRASYDKLKAIAVELAKAVESTKVHCGATTIRSWSETRRKLIKINNEAITAASKMLGGE